MNSSQTPILLLWPLLCLLLLTSAPSGCATTPSPPEDPRRGVEYQAYDLDTVKRNLKDLQPGAPKLEVLSRLGSPAVQQPDYWEYWPKDRPGVILPAEAIRIEFERGRYLRHRSVPIILGERLP